MWQPDKHVSEYPLLGDAIIRQSFRSHAKGLFPSPEFWRTNLNAARRFVLDAKMSAFIADLAHIPFRVNRARRPEVLDGIRHSAMPPFPTTWIEIDGWAFRQQLAVHSSHDVFGQVLTRDVPPRWGWLMVQHPKLENCVQMWEAALCDAESLNGVRGEPFVVAAPFSFVWNCKDEPLPWAGADIFGGMLSHGLIDAAGTPYIGVLYPDRLKARKDWWSNIEVELPDGRTEHHQVPKFLIEIAGTVRYAMSFLAVLNDVPAVFEEVRPTKGYVARGQYRKYLQHHVVRLTVPARRNLRLLARRLMVGITRRRRHEVRGHWRVYQRGEGPLCSPTHDWGALNDAGHAACKRCAAWRTWIPFHLRGDAQLGLSTHTYAVERGEPGPLALERG